MKTLIVTAHPSKKGFTHRIAQTYQKYRKKKGGESEIIDLYEEKYQQPFLKFEDMRGKWSGEKTREILQKKMEEADEFVFVHPMWWSAPPAVMKNFIDNNFTAGFAFRYEKGRPIGLFSDKRVRIFATADGPKVIYFLMKFFLKITFVKAIFGFCGMKLDSFDIFAEMRKRTDKDKEKLLEKVQTRVL